MISIQLKDLAFFAFHGLYEKEKLEGNNFVLNLHLHYQPDAEIVQQLDDTINYELLFKMVEARMLRPTPLLETIVMELCYEVMETFEQAASIFISLEKRNPPIPGMKGGVVVSFQLSRQN